MVDAPANVPDPVKADRARPVRRRRPLLFVLAAAILWLIGQGVGWFGAGPLLQQGQSRELGQGVTRPGGLGAGAIGSGGASLVADDVDSGAQPVAAGGLDGDPLQSSATVLAGNPSNASAQGSGASNSSDATKVAASNEASPVTSVLQPGALPVGMAADRFDSLLSLLNSHLAEHSLANATAALQRLSSQSLSANQRAHLAEYAARLQPLRQACEERVLEHVQKGALLQADEAAAQLVLAGVWSAPTVAAAAPQLTLGDNWQRALPTGGPDVPTPRPLGRNRRVRVHFREELHYGVVVSSSTDQVTVRLLSASGQSFPTVHAVACEPINSIASEAIEMGFVAVHAGEMRLSRLWLLRAHRLNGERTTRGDQLLQLLR